MLATDADLLVFFVEGRAQASAAVALHFGGTEGVLLTLLQVLVMGIVQERADPEWHSAGLETGECSGTQGTREDEEELHGNVNRTIGAGCWTVMISADGDDGSKRGYLL